MKTRFFALIVLLVFAATISSCYSSRKYGCPGNPTASTKFRA